MEISNETRDRLVKSLSDDELEQELDRRENRPQVIEVAGHPNIVIEKGIYYMLMTTEPHKVMAFTRKEATALRDAITNYLNVNGDF